MIIALSERAKVKNSFILIMCHYYIKQKILGCCSEICSRECHIAIVPYPM